jgi:hypothetical protein
MVGRPRVVEPTLARAGAVLAGSGPDTNTAGAAKKALKKSKKALSKANANATLLDECGPGASAAGSEACTAPPGPKGEPGTNGTAVAFAQVESDGNGVVEAKNVADTNVTRRDDSGSSPRQ